MRLVQTNPLIKILAVYVAGILLATYWLKGSWFIYPTLFFSLICIIAPLAPAYLRKKQLPATLVLLCLFILGVLQTGIITQQQNTQTHGLYQGYVKVKSFPSPTAKRIKCIFQLSSGKINEQPIQFPYRITAYLPKTWKDSLLIPGEFLLLSTELRPISHSGNPHSFNYKKYLLQHGITAQAFIKDNEIYRPHTAQSFNKIHQLRQYCKKQLAEFIPNKGNQGVLQALLLGFKKDLSAELQTIYARAGVIHMLAVSGLHVGIFYFLISAFLSLLRLPIIARWSYYSLLLLSLLLYAALTGFSPSVCRASLMFGCYILARWLKRDTHFYNILAFSAFILLLINPLLLFDVGFQLSYCAVLSIVWLQPKIAALYRPKTIVTKFIWSVTTVSFAAQVGTFPITIYYFHQFPVYFLISNFWAMLLIPIMLYLGVFVLLCSPFPPIAKLLGIILNTLTEALNTGIAIIEGIPGSVISSVYWQDSTFILIALGVLFLLHWLTYANKKAFHVGLLCFVCLIGWNTIQEKKTPTLSCTLYQTHSEPVFSIVKPPSAILIGVSRYPNAEEFPYSIKPHLAYEKITTTRKIALKTKKDIENGLFQIDTLKVAWIYDNSWKDITAPTPLKIDFLILSHQTKLSPQKISHLFTPTQVISHNSLVPWEEKKFQEYFSQQQIPYHNTKQLGAWQWSKKTNR